MPAGSELQVILNVAEQLRDELGDIAVEPVPGDGTLADRERLEPWGPTDVESARLVAALSRALAQIAAAAAGQADLDADEVTAGATAALARTELVMRGELMRGDEAALGEHLPGFVFLVVLPGAGMDRALELANRARVLLEEALG